MKATCKSCKHYSRCPDASRMYPCWDYWERKHKRKKETFSYWLTAGIGVFILIGGPVILSMLMAWI